MEVDVVLYMLLGVDYHRCGPCSYSSLRCQLTMRTYNPSSQLYDSHYIMWLDC